MSDDRIYPCGDCGVMRTKAEGGMFFTVCDVCWKKAYPNAAETSEDDAATIARLRAEVETLRAERDAERARAEQTKRERDEARRHANECQASSDEYEEAFRWWKAKAEARPAISHEMARTCVEEWDERCTVDGVHDGSTALPEWAPIMAALREHAGKATR
jgi:hypothetical protein